MIKAVRESRPEVGSSKIITVGSLTNSKAIDVLFLSPPETPFNSDPPTKVSIHFSSFKLLTKVFILFFRS